MTFRPRPEPAAWSTRRSDEDLRGADGRRRGHAHHHSTSSRGRAPRSRAPAAAVPRSGAPAPGAGPPFARWRGARSVSSGPLPRPSRSPPAAPFELGAQGGALLVVGERRTPGPPGSAPRSFPAARSNPWMKLRTTRQRRTSSPAPRRGSRSICTVPGRSTQSTSTRAPVSERLTTGAGLVAWILPRTSPWTATRARTRRSLKRS